MRRKLRSQLLGCLLWDVGGCYQSERHRAGLGRPCRGRWRISQSARTLFAIHCYLRRVDTVGGFGSQGLLSTRTSRLPCQVSAFNSYPSVAAYSFACPDHSYTLQNRFCYDPAGKVRSIHSTLLCSESSVNTKSPSSPSLSSRKACNWPSSGRHSNPSAAEVSTLKITSSIFRQSISAVLCASPMCGMAVPSLARITTATSPGVGRHPGSGCPPSTGL